MMTSTSRSPSKMSPRFRRTLTAAACALLVGPAALAQSSTYTWTGVPPQGVTIIGYNTMLSNAQSSIAPVTSTTTTTMGTSLGGPGAAPIVVVSNDSVLATAAGNTVTYPVGSATAFLSSLSTFKTLGVISGQSVTGSVLTATVTGSAVQIAEAGLTANQNTLSGNSVTAQVNLNQANQLVTGALDAGYSNTAGGNIAVTQGVPLTTTTTGGVVTIVNNQVTDASGANAGSGALVTGSPISLTVSTSTGPISSPQKLANNSVSAEYGGNTASTIFSASAGSSQVTGSVLVGNVQQNTEAAKSVNLTASVLNSGITADLRDGGGGTTNVAAPVSLSGNSINATSTGNSGTSQIVLAPGVTFAGANGAGANSAVPGTGTTVTADLGLANVQQNTTTSFNSAISGSNISVLADNLVVGGSASLTGNTIGSSSTGNTASSLIQTADALSGTVGAASSQGNSTVDVTSTTTGTIGTQIGIALTPATGSVMLSNNAVTADSTGNDATTTVSLGGSTIALSSSGIGARAGTAASASTLAGVGASLNSAQANTGTSSVLSTVSGGVTAVFATGVGGTSLDNATVMLTNNTVSAAATGNTSDSSMKLGTSAVATASVTGTAGLASSQQNAATVTGTATAPTVSISALNVASSNTPSILTVGSNELGATAKANDSTNQLSVAGANLSSTAIGGAVGWASLGAGVTSAGTYSLANAQTNSGSISTVVTDPSALIDLTGTVSGTAGGAAAQLTTSSNEISAATSGNTVANTLAMSATNVSSTNPAVGMLVNLQNNTAASESAAITVSGLPGATLSVGVNTTGAVTTGALTTSSNLVSASSTANSATNQSSLTATNFTAAGPTGVGAVAPGETATLAAYGVANVQNNAVTANTATINNMLVGLVTPGSSGAFTVSDNTVQGMTVGNLAVNGFSGSLTNLSAGLVGGTTLSTAGNLATTLAVGDFALANTQSSTGALTTNVNAGAVALTGPFTSGALTMTDNQIRSIAQNNSAGNALNLSGTNVATTASIVNNQAATGSVVSATQTAPSGASAAVGVGGALSAGVPITVTGNDVFVSAGQSEVLNQLNVSATNLSGAGYNTDVTYAAGVASGSKDFLLINLQQSTGGSTTASATPALIGAAFDTSAAGSPLAVSGNKVTAQAGSNNATNNLVLNATGVMNATSAINNVQISSTANTATVTGGLVGVTAVGAIGALNAMSTSISSNQVLAYGYGNTATNSLASGVGATLVSSASTQIANQQQNTGAITSTVAGMTIGTAPTTWMTGGTMTISGNSVVAQAIGNSAINSLVGH